MKIDDNGTIVLYIDGDSDDVNGNGGDNDNIAGPTIVFIGTGGDRNECILHIWDSRKSTVRADTTMELPG